MIFYVDGEWNGYGGDLISIALCPEVGLEFYECLRCENPTPWVEEFVMPVLGIVPISLHEMQLSLESYINKFDSVHIVADWPEDIAYFCRLLVTGPGTRINTPPLTFEIIRVDTVSHIPHCALEDARALKAHVKGD